MALVTRRLLFCVVAFVAITVVTFSILAASEPLADVEDPAGDPAAVRRLARLSERYALDRPLFFNPSPPDPAGIPQAARVGVEVPRLLAGDPRSLGAGLSELRRAGAPIPEFADGGGDGAALRRDVALWWRRHENAFLDRGPLWRATVGHLTETRYAAWLGDLVRLDFGDSVAIRPETPVLKLLAERAPATVLLMSAAALLLFAVGVPLGVFCAARRGGPFDRGASGVLFVLHAVPEFWLATLALVYLCSDAYWRVFPVGGLVSDRTAAALREGRVGRLDGAVVLEVLHHLVLPVLILVLPACVVVVRHVRAAAIEALGSRYVMAARARGLPERRILYVHVLRACAPTVVTMFTSVLPALVTGSILIEVLFGMTGMGLLTWQAATLRDYPVGMAILAITATVMLLAHLFGDLLHALLDPRARPS